MTKKQQRLQHGAFTINYLKIACACIHIELAKTTSNGSINEQYEQSRSNAHLLHTIFILLHKFMWTVPVDQVSYWSVLKSLMDRICLSVLHLRELNLFADGRRLNSCQPGCELSAQISSALLMPRQLLMFSRGGAVDSRSRTGDLLQSPLVRCREGSKPENPPLH